MFVQGFCGDVNCYHIFGTPQQARRNGERLGKAAAEAMAWLVPARSEPLDFRFRTVELPCRPMYTRPEIEQQLAARHAFIEELNHDPTATWVAGINLPEQLPAEKRIALVQLHLDYLEAIGRLLADGQQLASSLPITLGAIRIGDVGAALSPGENFTSTGQKVRMRSPFLHTLVCGDTNGLFGYLGTDDEIDRGGYETDSFWKMLTFGDARLAPAKGSADLVINTLVELLV